MDWNALPITPVILSRIAELEEFKGSWKTLKTLAPEKLTELRKTATIESVGSSTRIEGVKLTNKEIELLLNNLQTNAFQSRDEEEVAGYAEAMETVFNSWEQIPLTENNVCQLHRILLKYSAKDEYHKGKYKGVSNQVEAFDADGKSVGVIFQTAAPFETPRLMQELIAETKQALDDQILHSLLVIGVFIVRFLAIHPFQDGNGRLSRILTTLLLLRSGYAYVPYSSLESVVEENKEGYYLALRRTQLTLNNLQPDWNPWLDFFLNALCRQKQRLAVKIEREGLLQKSLPELSIKILELVTERGQATISDLETLTGEKRSRVKFRLAELVEQGYLLQRGQGRGVWYAANV